MCKQFSSWSLGMFTAQTMGDLPVVRLHPWAWTTIVYLYQDDSVIEILKSRD